eukprot:UN14369
MNLTFYKQKAPKMEFNFYD